MKTTTIAAIVLGLVGVAAIIFFATRPRLTTSTTSSSSSSDDDDEEGTGGPSRESRITRGIGAGLTELAAAAADAAS